MSTDTEIANLEWRVVEAAVASNPDIQSHWLRKDSYEVRELAAAVKALIAAREKAEAKGPTPIGSPN